MKTFKLRFTTPEAIICVALGFALFSAAASASTLDISGVTTPTTASIANCSAGAAKFTNCVSTAFVSGTAATITSNYLAGKFNGTAPTTQTFQSAFNTWNAAQTSGVTWTLVNGGALNNLTLTVKPFTASATAGTGGISNITVSVTPGAGYNGPSINQLVWTQGLYTNDSPTTPFGSYIDPPANTLDSYSFSKGGNGSGGAFKKAPQALPSPPANSNNVTVDIGASAANTAYADPIYPFQSANKSFFDGPALGWPSASFRAIALLSTVSETTDNTGKVTAATLTVYDGVSYGFDLSATASPVPEPGTPLLLAGGLLLYALYWRRRKHSSYMPSLAV
jgi:hypothetical protein